MLFIGLLSARNVVTINKSCPVSSKLSGAVKNVCTGKALLVTQTHEYREKYSVYFR